MTLALCTAMPATASGIEAPGPHGPLRGTLADGVVDAVAAMTPGSRPETSDRSPSQ